MQKTAMQFLANGKRIEITDLGRYAWLAVGYAPEKGVVYAFESRDAFIAWSKKHEAEDKVSRIFQIIDDAKQYEKADNTYAMRRQQTLVERITNDLNELSERSGLMIGSEELLLRASSQSNILEGRILNSAILWEHPNCEGRWLPIVSGHPYPDFRWFNFNDIASSLFYDGNVVLCEHTWFGGQGVSFSGHDIIDLVGWVDDCFSSGFAVYGPW